MKQRIVSATVFKTNCLSLLKEISKGDQTIIVTKRGRPVAAVTSVNDLAWQSPKGKWVDKITIVGNIVNPDLDIEWDSLTTNPVI